MANEADEQLPNTLEQSLASTEAQVEHAANLEHSMSGCLAAVCETLQKAAVEGVAARGGVHQQFRRSLKDESLKADFEKCQSKQAKDLFRKEWTSNRALAPTQVLSATEASKGTYPSLVRIAVEQRHRNSRTYSPQVCGVGPFILVTIFDALQVFSTSRRL